MKRNSSVCLMLIMFVASLLTPAAHSAPITAPFQDNSNFRFRTVTIRYKESDVATDPWISGPVSPKSVWLQFSVKFDPAFEVPPKVLLRVEIRRLCRLLGSGGHFLTARFQDHFITQEEEATVTNGTAEIAIKVHCPTCPHPKVCAFPDSDADPDHLGEGPYEALISANGSGGSGISLKSHSTQTTTPSNQLVHSIYFSTCRGQCPPATTTAGGVKTLLSNTRSKKKK